MYSPLASLPDAGHVCAVDIGADRVATSNVHVHVRVRVRVESVERDLEVPVLMSGDRFMSGVGYGA